MSQGPDQHRQRRGYLYRKRQAYMGVSAQLAQLVLLLFASAIEVVATLLGINKILNAPLLSLSVVISTVVMAGFTCLSVDICLYRWNQLKRAWRRSASIPYIPPVSVETLPVADVLVRAVHESQPGQREVLLRASMAGRQAPQEQLLRPTDMA
jgi:hypothetical protein